MQLKAFFARKINFTPLFCRYQRFFVNIVSTPLYTLLQIANFRPKKYNKTNEGFSLEMMASCLF